MCLVVEIAMERLREQNFRAIIGFLREAYVPPDVDTFAGWTVQALTGVVGAQRVSYNEMHRESAPFAPSSDLPTTTPGSTPGSTMSTRCSSTCSGRATAEPTRSPTSFPGPTVRRPRCGVRVRRQRGMPVMARVGAEHVVGHEQVAVAHVLDRARELRDGLHVGAARGL